MRRSISARIFAGFLMVVIAFSLVMAFTLFRMQRAREDLDLVNRCYLPLTLLTDRLYLSQENLLNTLDQWGAGKQPPKLIQRQVQLALQFRRHQVNTARKLVSSHNTPSLPSARRDSLNDILSQLNTFAAAFDQNSAYFETLFQAGREDEIRQALKALLLEESQLTNVVRKVAAELRQDVTRTAEQVEEDQTTALLIGFALVMLALTVSLVITFAARRTLRPLKRLVEGTKKISAGQYNSRVEMTSGDELNVLADEFNKMGQAIEEREQRLLRSERMAAAGRLASHITHEVRNPLNAIALNTEMLDEELAARHIGEKDEPRLLCSAVQKEVDRLTELTEEYLQFARLPKPSLEQHDINKILQSLMDFVGGELRAKRVGVKANYTEGLSAVLADEGQLRQAFLNLVRNGVEAMQEGGTLSVKTFSQNGDVAVQISDSGCGIPESVLLQIFDPFFSTKQGGSGLGLALTQQIIQEHNGYIGVESLPGQGTTFTVSLPGS